MEDEIKVGDFVRINTDHRIIALGIAKVVKIVNESIYIKNKFKLPITIDKNSIAKYSPNIIDLIEVGDYVNGQEVVVVYGYDEDGNDKDTKGIIETDDDYAYGVFLEDINIYSIVTKEQFEAIEYKVKE